MNETIMDEMSFQEMDPHRWNPEVGLCSIIYNGKGLLRIWHSLASELIKLPSLVVQGKAPKGDRVLVRHVTAVPDC